MNFVGAIWALAFSALLLILNYVHSMVRQCLNDKPLGMQSVFDSVLKDTLMLMRIFGSVGCLMTIVGRFAGVQDFLIENHLWLVVMSAVHHFFMVSLMVHVGFLSVCRVLCITRMDFLEETLGESTVRTISLAATATTSAICVFVLWYCDEILLGTITTFLTGKFTRPGNKEDQRELLDLRPEPIS